MNADVGIQIQGKKTRSHPRKMREKQAEENVHRR